MTSSSEVTWHSVDESPGKRSVYMMFKYKGHLRPTCELTRFLSPGIVPGECHMHSEDGMVLPVAWAYADEVLLGIERKFIRIAKNTARAWYKEDETDKKGGER